MNNQIDITKDTLLNIEQICEKLSISRSTFERMRGLTDLRSVGATIGAAARAFGNKEDDEEFSAPFPQPSCMIGRSPRWTANVINKWLSENSKTS
ncbi:MAG: hypothetical protein PHC99_10055 [Methylococcales bacterium]|nr:hypothetical protein [Methylococcales bacterium]